MNRDMLPPSSNSDDRKSTPFGETMAVPAEHRGVLIPGIPTQIGRYRILRKMDEGGMGTVYQAEQDKPRRVVALKVIRAGRMSAQHLRRFEHESQILGRLQHPGIAQIYEAGTADNGAGAQPFFAMEFIADAKPLTEYAASRRLGTRERMELVARICDAVQHAHQKGVIHRDLKPDNILVDASGQPKILDFGVAKATESDIQVTTMHTDVGQLVGTLSYMSPEQVVADPLELDVRSDVYALGVVLYELLSERLPYDISSKPIHEAARMIREQEPTRLSMVSRIFRGDVETVVAKALEKDKTRRYQSAGELAADIRRYLASEPIVARPASTIYQIRKFAQRNRAFVGAVAAVFLVLLSATGISTSLAVRARSAERAAKLERDRAQTEAAKAEQTTRFIKNIFAGIDPYQALGMDTTLLRRLLDGSEHRIESELAEQPEVEGAIRLTLGRAYMQLAAFDLADRNLRRASELFAKSLGDRDRQTLSARLDLAASIQRQGKHAEGVALAREVLAVCEPALGEDAKETVEALGRIGLGLTFLGRYAESESYLRKEYNWHLAHSGRDSAATLASMESLAQALQYLGRFPEAESLLQAALELRKRTAGADAPVTYECMGRLAAVWDKMEKHDQAEIAYRKVVDGLSRTLGPEQQQTLTMRNNLAACVRGAGRMDEALELFRDNLEMRRRALGPEHAETLYAIYNVGDVLRQQGRLDEAEPLLRQALEGRRRTIGIHHVETMENLAQLAYLLKERQKFDEAAELLGEAVQVQRGRLKPNDPALGLSLYNWAATVQNSGRNDQAEPIYREILAAYEQYHWKLEPFLAAAHNGLAKCLDARGEFEEADRFFQKGLKLRRDLYPTPNLDLGYSLNDIGLALLRRKDFASAEPYWREFLSLCESAAPPGDPQRAAAKGGLGACLAGLGRFSEAEPLLLAAHEDVRGREEARPDLARESISRLVQLYEAWDNQEPRKGYRDRAQAWSTTLQALGDRTDSKSVETPGP